ncbi:oligomeric complex COG6 [Guyanagaster necrorhizus]|uniref:Conserved oligomeric Golgi complex subunit 6 n=1 Tax=Guyanagaster necrorhizus TaxID=856835 RepID=A0A9P7W7X4_9AGAR|nr:oligomeric complex COG6 [Guyanagaster necrorhizus MCA 3950]KAG7452966.1 oligomeric complex COG6 [Guyanagaster necrorhizus MCA 3950]
MPSLTPPTSSTPSVALRKTSTSAQSRNPVSLRLYKVLGTNFDDEATKEALCTLSDLYATPSSRKGKVVQRGNDDDDDDDDTRVRSKDAAEMLPGEMAARARRNLRKDMEQKLAEGSRRFLAAFREVDQKLGELQKHVDTMHASLDDAEIQLQLTNEASSSLLEKAGNLRQERQEVDVKKSVVELFLGRFALSEEEIESMTSRDVPLGQRFFDAMDRTERIRDDCRVLMAGEEGPTKAGLEIMSSTLSYLEQGYEKIVRWCSYEFRQIGRDAHLEVTPAMREAVRRLRQRQELLTYALAELSQTRQASLLSSFLMALTRGGPSGLPRPIELHAHDPMRYIGDMLAWVHQAIAAEREFFESLFGLKADGRMVGSVRLFDDKSEEEDWIRELMDLAVGKLCVPLKESSIVSYKIANLLQFYLVTMRRTIGTEAVLSKTLQEITEVSYKVFFDAVEALGRSLLRVPLDNNDLSLTPPISIIEHAQVLRELMNVYQSSLLGNEDEEKLIAGFEHVLDIMMDPAIEICTNAAEAKARAVSRWDISVFVLNCLSYLLSVLEPFVFTVNKQKGLQVIINERVLLLTDEHYHDIMAKAGLHDIITVCDKWDRSEPLSYIPTARPQELKWALQRFSAWLSGLEVVQSQRLSHLTVQRLHTTIHQSALERMAQGYKVICDEVRRPENKYEAASTLLGSERPFGQAHLLWQIFGLEEKD